MTKIIGQEKLMTILNNYNIMNLPHAMLFIGPKGCGKHLIASYVATKFDLDLVSIDEAFSSEDINSFNYRTIKTLYLIDLNSYTEKQQNVFLKVLEDASSTAYFILLASSEANVLNTVLNRCIKYTFAEYSKSEIEEITKTPIDDLAYSIFKTPGKLLNLTQKDVLEIKTLAQAIFENLESLTLGHLLAASTKINYKDLYNKIDFYLFFDMAEYLSFEKLKSETEREGQQKAFQIYQITSKFKQLALQPNLLKEPLILNYLTNLWEAVNT